MARTEKVIMTNMCMVFSENRILVQDKTCLLYTSVSHKVNTNAGKSSEDGVWFGTSEPDDSKGALLYDTYVIEELKCCLLYTSRCV